MNSSTKINLLILPLFVSILLSVVGNLKPGQALNHLIYTLLVPVTLPANQLKLTIQKHAAYLQNIPQLEKENQNQKKENARLLTENEFLKQSVSDTKVLNSLKSSFREVIPVRLSGVADKYLVTSTIPMDTVKPGQPLVSNNILLGIVSEVNGHVAVITPLDHKKSPIFPVHTSSGQKGIYQLDNNHPQVADIPSQTPLVLGDTIFTEPSEVFPGNLIVGKITKTLTVSQEPLQKAEITLFDNLNNFQKDLIIVIKP